MTRRPERPEKPCASCGRRITWRKRWATCWDEVRYCSDRCRANRPGTAEQTLDEAVRSYAETRGARASFCPSEVARVQWPDDWRAHMEDVRCAARRLAALGVLRFEQRGHPVDPSLARGPVRLRWTGAPSSGTTR